MKNFVTFSIETHLFFARIMKEHALFLEAGFPCKDKDWIEKADYFREEFEKLLKKVVKISDGMVEENVLKSGELVTEFTIPAEKRTQHLTGIPIDSSISEKELKLAMGCPMENNRQLVQMVHQLNEKAICLLNGLIEFKESILKEVSNGCLFNANYPLLIKHIIREAELYRSTLIGIRQNRRNSCRVLMGKEEFWNRIMMEHALFIRGLLDPSEEQLIGDANEFAMEYKELLEMGDMLNCRALERLTKKSLKETLKYREFKEAGAKGILECEIASIILPLLADHVLREANHYIRLLESGYMETL